MTRKTRPTQTPELTLNASTRARNAALNASRMYDAIHRLAKRQEENPSPPAEARTAAIDYVIDARAYAQEARAAYMDSTPPEFSQSLAAAIDARESVSNCITLARAKFPKTH